MATTLSPALETNASPNSPSPVSSPSSNPSHPPLHPLITSPPAPVRRTTLQRPTSHASKGRLSQYSTTSIPSRSRPPSHVFPIFHSSLPYTNVRDFAYSATQPMHYGPPPESSRPPSGLSTPASESQKWLTDPPVEWESKDSWGSWSANESSDLSRGEQLAPIQFFDERDRSGPPYSEDEDIQSPVVSSSRHRKSKNGGAYGARGRSRKDGGDRSGSSLKQDNYNHDGSYSRGGDGSDRYDNGQGGAPGTDFGTYPSTQSRLSQLVPPYNVPGQRDSHFAGMLQNRALLERNGLDLGSEDDESSGASSPDMTRNDESRYSRDYQFTIASPDEEMHGKAVALFNFVSESENELPLVEGQVIWVSYRQAEGWLVAEDPKTQERGLVPEEYVRLLRDIRGGLNSLTGDTAVSPGPDSGTPTQAEHAQSFGHAQTASNGSNGYQQPIVSTFSTSSKDLHPYPQHLLDKQAGQAPPQVVHNHGQRGSSQANTPTLPSSAEGRSSSRDTKIRKGEDETAIGEKVGTAPQSHDVDFVDESANEQRTSRPG